MRRPTVELAPRLARVIVLLAGLALASSQVPHVTGHGAGQPYSGILVGAATATILALHFWYTARAGVAPRALAAAACAQAVLCLASGLPLGITAGLTSLPVASLLLARLWIPAGATVAAAGGIDVAHGAAVRDVLVLVLMSSLGGVLVYGLARLASLVQAVHAARVTLAAAAVSAERLRVADEVRDSISANLAAIRALAAAGDAPGVLEVALRSTAEARAASVELRSLSLAPEIAGARALLASAGVAAEIRTAHAEPLGNAGMMLATALRETVTEVVRLGLTRNCRISTELRDGRVLLRVENDGVRTADESIAALGPLAERVRAADGRFAARLEPDGWFTVEASMPAPLPENAAEIPTDPEYRTGLTLFVVTLLAFCVQASLYVPLHWLPAAIPTMALVCAVQLRFGLRDAWRDGRGGAWIGLLALAVAAYLPLNVFGRNWIGVTGYLAGSLLMALPYLVALPLVALAAATAGLVSGLHAHSLGNGCDAAFNSLVTGVLIYGLLRLIRLVRELHEADQRLTSAASVRERLRIARDLHDLLGHNLAAIVLKAELAKRFADRDAERAAAELRELSALAAKAQQELGTVLGESDSAAPLSFRHELDSAVAILKEAGVRTELDTVPVSLSPETSAALGVVLREAVTNVLRHSSAEYCRIALMPGVRLVVENNGVVAGPGGVTPPGSGLGNLSVRLAELDGTVRGTAEDGWYVLEVRVPEAATAPESSALENSAQENAAQENAAEENAAQGGSATTAVSATTG
jgi:signal transduction histidine kinase